MAETSVMLQEGKVGRAGLWGLIGFSSRELPGREGRTYSEG